MRLKADLKPALEAVMDIQWQFRRGILQKALNVAARPTIKAVKQNAKKIPKDSGTLAKAVQSRSSKGRKNILKAWVGIGATTALEDVEQTGWRGKKYKRRTKLKGGGVSEGVRPSKYVHLKEYGGSFGRFAKKTRVKGNPLFKAAWAATSEAQILRNFNAEVEKGVEKAFAKGRAKARAAAKRLIS